MRAICLMKNSSTRCETAFHLKDNLQRGQCCSTKLRTLMEICPGYCWTTGAFWVQFTQPYSKIFLRLSFRHKSFRSSSYPATCRPFQEQAGNLGSSVDGNLGSGCPGKIHDVTAQWVRLWRSTLPLFLSCFQCMKKLKYIYIVLCDGKTNWEEYFKSDEKHLI